MSNNSTPTPEAAEAARQAAFSALFANLVMQQTNMALVFLGKLPHHHDQEQKPDLDAARMFIDTLEMLAVKTRGNLANIEQELLQHSLTDLRMHFVEAVDRAPAAPAPAPEPAAPSAPTGATAKPPGQPDAQGPAQTGDDSRKRFVKKY
jgi:hypothetical protein